MNNDNMAMLVQMAQNGGNTIGLLNQMARQNPQLAQAMKMINGKNTAQLQQMAQNMAKEKGLKIEDIARQLGLRLPG